MSNLWEMRCLFKKQKGKPNSPGTWSFFSSSFWGKAEIWEGKTGEGKGIMREMLRDAAGPHGTPGEHKGMAFL